MTPDQKTIVRETWSRAVPVADIAAARFYDRLFELDPSLRSLFANSDMAAQHRKLIDALATVIASLDQLEALVPALQDLGRRHAGYGVVDDHYRTVGRALLDTMESAFPEHWNPAAEDAWSAAYGAIADVMCAAARKPH